MKKEQIVYFDREGEQNTETTLHEAYKAAKRLNIKVAVVASTSGNTALKAGLIFGESVRVIGVHFQEEKQAKWGSP